MQLMEMKLGHVLSVCKDVTGIACQLNRTEESPFAPSIYDKLCSYSAIDLACVPDLLLFVRGQEHRLPERLDLARFGLIFQKFAKFLTINPANLSNRNVEQCGSIQTPEQNI